MYYIILGANGGKREKKKRERNEREGKERGMLNYDENE